MIKKTNLKMLLVMAVCLLGIVGTATGQIIYVDPCATGANDGSSWGDAYNYLQDGLADANVSGDDIWVAKGTYKPDANTANPGSGDRTATFQLINGVAIYGGFAGGETGLDERDWQNNKTILSGDLLGNDGPGWWENNVENSYHVVTGSDTDATAVLDGFTITRGNADGSHPDDKGGGMYNISGSPTVTNCIFIKNWADEWGGGMHNLSSDPTLTNCAFSRNGGDGMYNGTWSSPTVTNCTFYGNDGYGMYNYNSSDPTVTNCIFWGAICNAGGSSPNVNYCNVGGGYPSGVGNIDADPLFVDTPDNLRLSAGSPCIDAGDNTAVPAGVTTDLDGKPRFVNDPETIDTGSGIPPIVDMGAYEYQAAPIFVDADASGGGDGTSWGTAYKYLQDGLDDANSVPKPVAIWVAAGTYHPDANNGYPAGTGVREATFQLINGAAIYGGLAGDEDPCTFELADRDLVANETILSGDIGVADVNTDNSCHVVTGSGTDANAILDGFTITAGNANEGGGGDLERGGGMFNDGWSSPTVRNCTFSANSATLEGGGMFNYSSSPSVTNCRFTANSATLEGGGIYNYSFSSPTVTNCTFSGNSASQDGGGICNRGASTPSVTNCTFRSNTAGFGGGGMYNNNSDPCVTNCILWGNSASTGEPEIDNAGSSSPIVTYTCVKDEYPDPPVYPGTGNIDEDPLFVDPNGADGTAGTEDDNLRLSYGSPCIDAGDNSAVPAGVTRDIEDELRFVDDPVTTDTGNGTAPIVDMGAHEYSCGGPERPYPVGDLNLDCHVDFFDIAIVAAHWLECTAIECD